jgi:hypothetical protein
LVPSDEQHNQIRVYLIRKFKWNRIGTIYSTKAKYTLTHNLLIRELDKMGVYTQSRSVPSESTVDNSSVYEVILNEFLANDIKIIIGLFDMETAIKLFCEVYKKSMYGKTYMGIIRTTFVIDEKGKIENIIEKVDTKNHSAQII